MKETKLHIIGAKPYDKVRDICHDVKIDTYELINNIAARFIPVLPSLAVLIPVPGHDGKATHTIRLAAAVMAKSFIANKKAENDSDKKHVALHDCLKCNPHESFCQRKHNGEDISDEKLEVDFYNGYGKDILASYIKEGYTPILVDNVVDTGKTIRACLRALEPVVSSDKVQVIAIGDTGRHKII